MRTAFADFKSNCRPVKWFHLPGKCSTQADLFTGRESISKKEIKANTVAEAFLAVLGDRGVEYLFANGGTDFPPIVEAYCSDFAADQAMPKPMVVAHEFAAVSMAHGHYMVSGKPQAVMVHVNVGTANALGGLLNAWRENVPIFMTSGRTPIYENDEFGSRSGVIHWGQEMRDQAAMVRESVKWDYELRGPAHVEAVVDRALRLAMTEPRGPVYLSLPREVLAQSMGGRLVTAGGGCEPAAPAYPDPAALEEAARLLAKADNPLIVTLRAGRDVAAVPVLAEFAERFAMPVVEFWANRLSLSSDHPMHLGFDVMPWIEDADAVLVLDTPVPWLPGKSRLADSCAVIDIGPDPVFSDYPMRGFPSDVAITSGVATALGQMSKVLDRLLPETKALSQRRARITGHHETARTALGEKLEAGAEGAMTAAWVSHCVGQAIGEDAILVNELGAVRSALPRTRPGTYFATAITGGLGWGLPAALGAKLAAPDSLVVATLGDGSYMFANPVVCHHTAEAQNLPVLTVVFNNAMWAAVDYATRSMYPDGDAAGKAEMPLTKLEPSPEFEKIVAACGGHGERVDDPGELPAALERAIHAVQNDGRQALLNVIMPQADPVMGAGGVRT